MLPTSNILLGGKQKSFNYSRGRVFVYCIMNRRYIARVPGIFDLAWYHRVTCEQNIFESHLTKIETIH